MTGTLHANTIQKANGSPVDLTGQSAAKAWSNLNGTSTIAERDSFNISGYVDNGTGDYTYTISSDMSDANYAHFVDLGDEPAYVWTSIKEPATAGTFRQTWFWHYTTAPAAVSDVNTSNLTINGDLA